jgi:hypothetical protein
MEKELTISVLFLKIISTKLRHLCALLGALTPTEGTLKSLYPPLNMKEFFHGMFYTHCRQIPILLKSA